MWMQDLRIIARQHHQAGAVEVIAQRQQVMLMDCSTIWAHRTVTHGAMHADQRALALPDGSLQLISLERMAPGITAELQASSERDAVGVVLYGLRARYPTQRRLLDAAARLQLGTWRADDQAGYVWHPAPSRASRRAA